MASLKYQVVTRKMLADLADEYPDLYVVAMTAAKRIDETAELTPTWLQAVRLWRETIDDASARIAARSKGEAWSPLRAV